MTSDVDGIACEPTCRATYPAGTQVTLTASPASGSAFVRWTRDCDGETPTCTLSMGRSSQVGVRWRR